MNYVLSILKEKAEQHKKEIERLNKEEADFFGVLNLAEDEINNQKQYIQQIEEAVKILTKNVPVQINKKKF